MSTLAIESRRASSARRRIDAALEIVAGVRVCQLVLMRTEGEAVYRGRFQHQREI